MYVPDACDTNGVQLADISALCAAVTVVVWVLTCLLVTHQPDVQTLICHVCIRRCVVMALLLGAMLGVVSLSHCPPADPSD